MNDHPRVNAVFERNKNASNIVCYAELETESRKLETELNEMRSLFTSYILCEETWRNESTDNKVNAVIEANFMREKAKQLLKL